MESIVWAVDLVAVTFLCFWALKQDNPPKHKNRKRQR
jgi:hypothetical protein